MDEENSWYGGNKTDRINRARSYQYARQPYSAEDMLIALVPNEEGYYPSFPHDGGPFDVSKYRLIKAGWDHDHCSICGATIEPGDEWWAAEPPNEIGHCLTCHAEVYPTECE